MFEWFGSVNLKDAKIKLRAKNFPKQLIDKQKKKKGVEV